MWFRTVSILRSLLLLQRRGWRSPDRKSTRLNSSHSQISYAVFCLKKKKKKITKNLRTSGQKTDEVRGIRFRDIHQLGSLRVFLDRLAKVVLHCVCRVLGMSNEVL